jgi:hypothetical protein
MEEVFLDIALTMGFFALYAVLVCFFICLCLLTKVARDHYLNAKCEVQLFVEFLQWKSTKQQGGKE